MRFIEGGPDIPDELLWAQDEGKVVFFCGAGVSRARAGLPDFNAMTSRVLDDLRANKDSAARKMFSVGAKVEAEHKVPGVITSDRIFGLLERDFTVAEIEKSVAGIVKPNEGTNLSAHRTLLKLSTLPTGQTRLVTTNFDRLFEACAPRLKTSTRSSLPHTAFNEADWGIVHLHGVVDKDYEGATPDGFVLSSASFGDAYLAAGWAREFVKDVLTRHVAVFIGYSANDPPIRYLLEGLRQTAKVARRAYAFQDFNDREAIAEWDEKGVQAISYKTESGCGHKNLWLTLDAWAQRSQDPPRWRHRTLKLAKKGPRALAPHQRGMVAHLVRSTTGAKDFASFDPPIPAEWLCVFDAVARYGDPAPKEGRYGKTEPVDPFALYGLDNDLPPSAEKSSGQKIGRRPPGVWDAFEPSPEDMRALSRDNLASSRGFFAKNLPYLPRRHDFLADWIVRVADQPACAWWAGQQAYLHWSILGRISLRRPAAASEKSDRVVEEAWSAIRELHTSTHDENRADALQFRVGEADWSERLAEEFVSVYSPRLKLKDIFRRPVPPDAKELMRRSDLVQLTSAINSAPGKMAEIIMKSLGEREFAKGEGYPQSWHQRAEQLLALPGEGGPLALSILTQRLPWLYYVDPDWTDANLLSILTTEDMVSAKQDAFWGGYFSGGQMPTLELYNKLRPYFEAFVRQEAHSNRRGTEVLAVQFLSGWKSVVDGQRLVSNEELGALILEGSDEFRRQILWRIDRFSRKEEEWASDLLEFLRNVWPKQKAMKTAELSTRLVELALAQDEHFDEIASIVATLVTPISGSRAFIDELYRDEKSLASKHPQAMLTLLYAILPDEKSQWPYGAETALSTLIDAAPALRADQRYIELNQRS